MKPDRTEGFRCNRLRPTGRTFDSFFATLGQGFNACLERAVARRPGDDYDTGWATVFEEKHAGACHFAA